MVEDHINKKEKKEERHEALESGKYLEFSHYIIAYCNIGVNEALFNPSFTWINT